MKWKPEAAGNAGKNGNGRRGGEDFDGVGSGIANGGWAFVRKSLTSFEGAGNSSSTGSSTITISGSWGCGMAQGSDFNVTYDDLGLGNR